MVGKGWRFLIKLIAIVLVLSVSWSSASFGVEWRRVMDSIVIGVEAGAVAYLISYWAARASTGKEEVDKGSLYLFSVAVGITAAFAVYSSYDRIRRKGKGSGGEGELLPRHRAEGGG